MTMLTRHALLLITVLIAIPFNDQSSVAQTPAAQTQVEIRRVKTPIVLAKTALRPADLAPTRPESIKQLAGGSVCYPNVGCHSQNMVATVDPQATDAALDALRNGGNAIDAAIAACLTLGVVDGYNSGIGGGCFILIHTADSKMHAIDGRETAPAAAHRDFYRDKKTAEMNSEESRLGPKSVAVPGALKAFEQAIDQFGELDLPELLLPAAQIAEEGFAVSEVYYRR